MKWQYVSEIQDINVFDSIEKEYDVHFSDELITFIKKYNAGTPEKYHIKINGTERVVGSILSFNRNEEDVDSVFLALEVIKGKRVIPFAVDPFGNYFCDDRGKIVFWKHEENVFDDSDCLFKDFVDLLY